MKLNQAAISACAPILTLISVVVKLATGAYCSANCDVAAVEPTVEVPAVVRPASPLVTVRVNLLASM